jgi:ABC-type antimicrobial peptide transport system permease subunit
MTQPGANPVAIQQPLGLGDIRLYLATSAMVLGNVLLPYAVHRIPDGGRIFLPIFFFTLIAGWRFGMMAGLLTGLLSPLANHFLTGMPPAPALQSIMVQSALLGALASVASARSRRLSLPILTLVVLLHQTLILLPLLIQSGVNPVLAALERRLPGLLLQIFGGFALLWFMGRHLPSQRPTRVG